MTIIDTMPELVLRSLDTSWSYARWEQLPDDGHRYEVIDGVLYMTTAPSSYHQWIVQQLFLALHAQLIRPGVGVAFLAPIGVLMPGCDPVQPDAVVVRAEHRAIIVDKRIRGVPDLLIEVLSPSSVETDTEIKRRAYARAGVPEYWIIRPAERDAFLYTEPDASLDDYVHVEHCSASGDLVSPTLPVRLTLADLFAGAPDTTV
jgi:Uma2 family endonuclease